MPFNFLLNVQYEISVSKFNGNFHASLNNSSKLSPHFTKHVVHLATQVQYISVRLYLYVVPFDQPAESCNVREEMLLPICETVSQRHTLYSRVCKMRHSIFLLSQNVFHNNFFSQITLVVNCFFAVDIVDKYTLCLSSTQVSTEKEKSAPFL